ncbi:cytotardin [Halyomorpha halys]|uniref:cytotardin n=1 Tax=Halyomorpha halys TaxID=286706 RepID=UPI0006D520AD
MDNKDIQQYLIKSSLIESRLIILKRRAAEADFLREERDMLISRLKLYNPDYVWPDSGINKCLKLPIDKEFEQVQKRNENLISENGELIEARKQLRSQNDDLKAHIQSLEKELGNMKKDYSNFEVLSKENEQLKTLLQEMASLKDEKEQLLIEKEQLKEDLNKLLDAGTNESDQNSRMLLKQLYIRINNCSEQYNNLLKELWSKEVQIDVLTGKITQLNAQLNEPYISAKIKLSRGKNLSDEEAYMWAVSNLEMTNKKMNCELQKVTDQLNLVTEKYMKIKDELGPMKRSQKPNGPVPPYELENALRKLQEDEYIWELKT